MRTTLAFLTILFFISCNNGGISDNQNADNAIMDQPDSGEVTTGSKVHPSTPRTPKSDEEVTEQIEQGTPPSFDYDKLLYKTWKTTRIYYNGKLDTKFDPDVNGYKVMFLKDGNAVFFDGVYTEQDNWIWARVAGDKFQLSQNEKVHFFDVTLLNENKLSIMRQTTKNTMIIEHVPVPSPIN